MNAEQKHKTRVQNKQKRELKSKQEKLRHNNTKVKNKHYHTE